MKKGKVVPDCHLPVILIIAFCY